MAELKYERYITKMSFEQKLKLITSREFYKNSSCEELAFPVFSIEGQPYGDDCKDTRITQFPSDAALACAWSNELVEEVYFAEGEEAHAVNSFAYYNVTNDPSYDGITDNHFLLGKFNAAKISGLNRGNQFVNFENMPADDESESFIRSLVLADVFTNSTPDSMIVSDALLAEEIKRRYSYDRAVYGVVSTVDEALEFLYNGGVYLFLKEDIFEELSLRLSSLTKAYKAMREKYYKNAIKESKFASLLRNFKVFDEGIIDAACDYVIGVLFSMKTAKEAPCPGFKTVLGKDEGYFDEKSHYKLAFTAACQSAVLLKNEGCLPLGEDAVVAMIGESAKELKYRNDYFNSRPTLKKTPFDAVNEFDLKTAGFALGYAKGEPGRSDLIDSALTLASQANTVLLYLSAAKGSDKLPPEQLEILDELYKKQYKIVAVVDCGTELDLSFQDKCSAVLLMHACGQGGVMAALEIITGGVCPSGKLAKPMGVTTEEGYKELYPIGYGLSYTSFAYSNFMVNESGVSFTVRNEGGCDGFAVPQMYVRKKDSPSYFSTRQLKGFAKVFVRAGDAVRVKIPFDDLTFRQHDEKKGNFVEGGQYTVVICETLAHRKLAGKIVLKESRENSDFKNTIEQSSDEGAVDFSERGLPPDVANAKKRLPFGLRLFLVLLFAAYSDGLLALFAFGDVFESSVMLYAIVGVLAGVINIFAVVYLLVISRQRKRQKYLHKNDVLTDMLDQVGEFTEVAKIKYKVPVVDESKKAEDELTDQPEEQEETATPASYEVNFDAAQEDVEYSERVSFEDLYSNIREYAMGKGVTIEINSARLLVAALASSKLIFLTSKNAEFLPAFAHILNDYFGNEDYTEASDEWSKPDDLLWTESDGVFVPSPFSKAVYSAVSNKDKLSAQVIGNVNLNNLGSYFRRFLDYANHPSEEYVLKFNDETSFRMPDNMIYVLVPKNGVLESLPPDIIRASVVVDLVLNKAESAPEEAVEPKVISCEDFLNILNDAKEQYYVSEASWKKVDALAEYVNRSEKFTIGNRNILHMEKITSVLIELGADEPSAVTVLFLSKLVYILKNTRVYRQDGGEKVLFAQIEKLFAEEELTKIQRALVKPIQE